MADLKDAGKLPERPDDDRNDRPFNAALNPRDEYTDQRPLWNWKSKYDTDAHIEMKWEGLLLFKFLAAFLVLSGISLIFSGNTVSWQMWAAKGDGGALKNATTLSINFSIICVYFVGCVGGTMFSIKWLIHSVATGRWHLDRRYWRLLTPFMGGVYACVVLTLFDAGFFPSSQSADSARATAPMAALAFLIGYFSDGVSGLLSNIANAVFGTIEKK